METQTIVFYLICILPAISALGCQKIDIYCKGGGFPSEVTWGVEYLNGTTIYSASGYKKYKSLCLPVGSYQAWGKDSFGDS